MGHYAQARTYAKELLSADPDHRIQQLYALALSKSGVPEAAQEYLESTIKHHPDDPETMGILGGIYKELFKKKPKPEICGVGAGYLCEKFRGDKKLLYGY